MAGKGPKNILWVLLAAVVIVLIVLGISAEAEKYNANKTQEQDKQEEILQEREILCAGSQKIQLDDDQLKIVVKARPGCWSGWIVIPPGAYEFWIYNEKNASIHVEHFNGSIYKQGPDTDPIWLGDTNGIFRVRGIEKPSKITITIKPLSH